MIFVREDELDRPLMSKMWSFSDSTHLEQATKAEWEVKIQVGQLISHWEPRYPRALCTSLSSHLSEWGLLLQGGFDGSE